MSLKSLISQSRSVWRSIAPLSLRRRLQPAVRGALNLRAELSRQRSTQPTPGPLIVSGFLHDSRGIGRGARLTALGLKHAGFNPVEHDIAEVLAAGGHSNPLPLAADGGVWLLHCNAPEAMQAIERITPSAWRNRYRIGYWAYELPRAPASWRGVARFFHEIWCPSVYVADALRAAGIAAPLRVMPHPVGLGLLPLGQDRSRFGLPPDAYTVLSMGDFRSSATRKNLAGALDIYCRAFAPDEGRRLVIKTLGNAHPDAFAAEVSQRSGGRQDIIILAAELDDAGMATLIASCDVLLSPHRAEGFGLPIAEALLAGRPALATGWSGNLEFMSEVPELLIPFRLTPVSDPDGVYLAPGQMWAEPDVTEGARRLRALADDPACADRLAARGRQAALALAGRWTAETLGHTALGRLRGP